MSGIRCDQINVVDRFEATQLLLSSQQPSTALFSVAATPELDQPSTSQVSESSTSSTLPSTALTVSVEDCGIHTIPLITLQGIWSKAEALINGSNMITPVPGNDELARAVMSYHSDTPHIVRKKGSSQFVCDSHCVQWKSSQICAHTVAVSNIHGCLREFLNWYVKCSPKPNFTALGMSGMPSGRGKKNQQTRKRKPAALPTRSDVIMSLPLPRPSFSQSSGQPITTITPPTQMPPIGQPLVFVGQSNSYSHSPYSPASPQIPVSPPIPVSPNSNPFYLKFITGNIRICQGCRGSLRSIDGEIPPPPYNLTIARAERRSFRDVCGNLVTPNKETVSHYHCRVDCVQAVDPLFVPLTLIVPSDVYSQLHAIHRDYLSGVFGLSL